MATGGEEMPQDLDDYFQTSQENYTADLSTARAAINDHECLQEIIQNQIGERVRHLQEMIAETGEQLVADVQIISESIHYANDICLKKLRAFASLMGKTKAARVKHSNRDKAVCMKMLEPWVREMESMKRDIAAFDTEEVCLVENANDDEQLIQSLLPKLKVSKTRRSAFCGGLDVSRSYPFIREEAKTLNREDPSQSRVRSRDRRHLEAQLINTIPRDMSRTFNNEKNFFDKQENFTTLRTKYYPNCDKQDLVKKSPDPCSNSQGTPEATFTVYKRCRKILYSHAFDNYKVVDFAVTEDPLMTYVIATHSKYVDIISLISGDKERSVMLPLNTSSEYCRIAVRRSSPAKEGLDSQTTLQQNSKSKEANDVELYLGTTRKCIQLYKCEGLQGSFLPLFKIDDGRTEALQTIQVSSNGDVYLQMMPGDPQAKTTFSIQCYSNSGHFRWRYDIPSTAHGACVDMYHEENYGVFFVMLGGTTSEVRIVSSESGADMGTLIDYRRHGIYQPTSMAGCMDKMVLVFADRIMIFQMSKRL